NHGKDSKDRNSSRSPSSSQKPWREIWVTVSMEGDASKQRKRRPHDRPSLLSAGAEGSGILARSGPDRRPDRLEKPVEVGFGPGLLPAVPLLEGADQLVLVALGLVEVVVGELAPEPLGIALELLPASFKDVVVHGRDSFLRKFRLRRSRHARH